MGIPMPAPFYKPEQLEIMRKLDEATARLRGSKSKLEMMDALRSVTHWHDALKESLQSPPSRSFATM